MKEFRVSRAMTGSEGKPAIEIASMLGLDTTKGYIGPKWNYDTECWHFLGERKP